MDESVVLARQHVDDDKASMTEHNKMVGIIVDEQEEMSTAVVER